MGFWVSYTLDPWPLLLLLAGKDGVRLLNIYIYIFSDIVTSLVSHSGPLLLFCSIHYCNFPQSLLHSQTTEYAQMAIEKFSNFHVTSEEIPAFQTIINNFTLQWCLENRKNTMDINPSVSCWISSSFSQFRMMMSVRCHFPAPCLSLVLSVLKLTL